MSQFNLMKKFCTYFWIKFINKIYKTLCYASYIYHLWKNITILNSGLQAAVLAVRLKCTILEETNFDIHEIGFWIVLKINLSYIWNPSKRFSIYVKVRLHKIKLNPNVKEWCFIPEKNNLANQCTWKLSHSLT